MRERSVPELPIAVFGDKTHVVIDRTFGFIRSWAVTGAARHDAAVLREIVTFPGEVLRLILSATSTLIWLRCEPSKASSTCL